MTVIITIILYWIKKNYFLFSEDGEKEEQEAQQYDENDPEGINLLFFCLGFFFFWQKYS